MLRKNGAVWPDISEAREYRAGVDPAPPRPHEPLWGCLGVIAIAMTAVGCGRTELFWPNELSDGRPVDPGARDEDDNGEAAAGGTGVLGPPGTGGSTPIDPVEPSSRHWVTVRAESESETIYEAVELEDAQFGARVELARSFGRLTIMGHPDSTISAVVVAIDGKNEHLFFLDHTADPPSLTPLEVSSSEFVTTWGGHWNGDVFEGYRRIYDGDTQIDAARVHVHRDVPEMLVRVDLPSEGSAYLDSHDFGSLAALMHEPDRDALYVAEPTPEGHDWRLLDTLAKHAGGLPRFSPDGLRLSLGYDDRATPDFETRAVRLYSRSDSSSADWLAEELPVPSATGRIGTLWAPDGSYMLLLDDAGDGIFHVDLESLSIEQLGFGIQPVWFDDGQSIVYRTSPPEPNQAPNGMSWIKLDADGPVGPPVPIVSSSETFTWVGGRFKGRNETEIVFRADTTNRHIYAVTLDESIENLRRLSGSHRTDGAALSEDRNQVAMRAFTFDTKSFYLVLNRLDDTQPDPEKLAVPLPHWEPFCFAPGDQGLLLAPNHNELTGDPASEARWYPDPMSESFLRFDDLYPDGFQVTALRPALRPCGLE